MQVNGTKRFLVYEESSGDSSHKKYTRLVSCGYELILYTCSMPMFMTGNENGYINEMKPVWSATCCDKHG